MALRHRLWPWGLRAEYEREVQARLARPVTAAPLTDTDLARLPGPVRRYLRLAGAVGPPRVQRLHARWRGRIRGGPHEPWMPFTAGQHNFVDEPARFFFMRATRGGLPVDVFHAFRDGEASMRVRLLSLVPIASAHGPEMTRAETVTLFNDLCVLAPSALADPAIRWEALDARSARGHYTAGANTVSAVLSFNEDGELVNFVSGDRLAASADGRTFTRQRWSTPLSDYRQFGRWRLCSRGEGRWHADEGEFVYIELELVDLTTNA